MTPVFFTNRLEFRAWLNENHLLDIELWVGYYKVNTGKQSITWSQSVDEAICYGWIDGIRKTINEDSYTIRFTKRRPNSIWSTINIAKVADLLKKGLMQPAGIAAYEKRQESKSSIYSYENESKEFTNDYQEIFKLNLVAWSFFNAQAPSYIKISIHWVMSAKQFTTQKKRLQKLIFACNEKKRLW